MQNIDLICVGKLNAPYFAAGVAEAVGVSARDAPHSAQKRASSGYSERQRGQVFIVFSLKSYRLSIFIISPENSSVKIF